MERIINICGTDVKFKATASTTRKYRAMFNRDLFIDINNMQKNIDNGQLTATDLECFENLAYIMAKQADENIIDNPDQWLDQFEMMSIYEVLPQLIELWQSNTLTLNEPKKKVEIPNENSQ